MISGVMVVHNEEKVVERALASLKGVVDEILVVHDGECTDKTIKICEKYKARVFIRPHVGIAEPHRAWLYNKAKGDWILQLDADEFLSDDLKRDIPSLVKNNEVAIYELVWPTWNGEKYVTFGWPHKKALFQKNKINFLALPHCEVTTTGKIVQSNLVLEHRPNYDNHTWKTFKTKWMKWAKIHATWIKKYPSEYDSFPKTSDKLPVPRYYAIKKYPLLFALPLGIYQGGLSYILGGYKLGWSGIKISLMNTAYWAMVGVYLSQLN